MNSVLLGNLAYYVTDKVPVSELNSNTYVGVDNMMPNYGHVVISEYVPDEGYATKFIPGDILIGNIRPYFKKIWRANFEGGCSNDVLVVRSNGIVSSKYLYSCLATQHFFDFDLAGAKGSKMPRGDKEHIMRYLVPILDSRELIGEFVDNVNLKIMLNNSICSDLESMAKLLYDYWFMQFDFPDENGRPYKSSGGKMVWNDELKREIPEGWNVTNVGQITDCLDSKRVPLSNKEREEISGIIPYYGATGIMGYVNKAIFNGDYVLLAEDGSVMDSDGHPILQRVSGECWINNHAHVLEPHDGYSCKLLMMILKDIPVVSIKTGSIQMKINQANLNDYQIVEIPSKLRKKLCEKLDVIDEQLLFLERENQELVSLRDFLLPMLMNGQIKIEDVKAS